MKNLILITSEYPYFSGETFLSNELPYLSNSFNEIYIFSINGRASEKNIREIPQNARAFPLENTISKTKYIKYIILGLRKAHNDLRINEKDPRRIAGSLYTRGRALEIAKQIMRIIKEKKLVVNQVTIYSFWFAYQAVSAWLLADKLTGEGNRVMCVSRAHGYDLYWERATGGYLPFQDASLRNLDYCYPCSAYGTKYLIDKYPWAKDKVITERLGTKDLGLNPYSGEKTFVTCCNLEPLKRMPLFAEAFCEVAKTNKNVKWICIGSGNDELSIRSIVNNSGTIAQVELVGRLNNEKVMEIYRKEGIMFFCNVSTTEGLPVSIMEAMSFGIPVFATDVGGTSELVDDNNGRLVDANISKSELVKALRLLIEMPSEEYRKKRAASRDKWEKTVSAERNYIEFCGRISKSKV